MMNTPSAYRALGSGSVLSIYFGELFPRVGFIVTKLETDSRAVVKFYVETAGAVRHYEPPSPL